MTLIEGNTSSDKTDVLVREYINLINLGISAKEILVICQSPNKKRDFLEKIKSKLENDGILKPQIYTFLGLCYNFISNYWPVIENKIKDKNAKIEPNLCGLEISQYIFRKCAEEFEFRGYNSRVNLLHQLLRRYALICHNALSKDEIKEKTKLMNDVFSSDIENSINLYRKKTLELRSFDYLRQIEAFSLIYREIKNNYKYVFIDDGDEITPACFEYLKHIKPTVKKFFIAYDKNGSSRKGYLCAQEFDFKSFLDETPNILEDKNPNGNLIFQNIKNEKPISINNLEYSSFIKRIDMIDFTIEKINSLLKNGVKPAKIGIITPDVDYNLIFSLKKINSQIFLLSGSTKLYKNSCVHSVLNLLKVINKMEVPKYELSASLFKILDENIEQNKISEFNFEKEFEIEKDMKLSEEFYKICEKYMSSNAHNEDDVQKLSQILKQITDFENILENNFSKTSLINQLEHTIISENPIYSPDILENSIILSTPQKFIDNGIKTKYQFWLDCSSDNWLKQDTGPLYNAWIFQKNWDKKEFSLEDNINLNLDKTARILRKLYLNNDLKGKIYVFSSSYDFSGNEYFIGIEKFFKSDKNTQPSKKEFNIKPREDQKPVLEYKKGKMAINAVAGSGKTTIMLALIMKLLENNVRGENIFVLTFMESAARNFKERIKLNMPNLEELPQISTIHGLALRILRENNNYTKVGLSDDFEIIDDIKSYSVISKILGELELVGKKTDFYTKAISTIKMNGAIKQTPLNTRIYNAYQNYLRENNLIDYDDLLIYSLKILNENEDIRKYYQNIAHYIIEDEAQDSSAIQQKLINILGGKFKNIIRCGDINQSITATFTNSDVKGFRDFIENNNCVKMDCSQRCAKNIYSLANNLIEYSKTKQTTAFLDVKMKPVEGKNPKAEKELEAKIFKNSADEKSFVSKEIKSILKKDKNATIGILLRNKYLIDEWEGFLENDSIKTCSKKDIPLSNPVFRVVLSILDFLLSPTNQNVLSCYKTLRELGFYSDDYLLENFIKKYDKNFILEDNGEFAIWWDLKYFLSHKSENISHLALEIGDYYFSNSKERANIYSVSSLIEKIFNQERGFEKTINKLKDISKKSNYKSIKFFEVNEKAQNTTELMTLHKSKGDEFDYVFIPELTKENLSLNPEDIKLRDDAILIENLKENKKTKEELKTEISEENFRLLYVGITRARKTLFLSSALEYKRFYKNKKEEPSEIFKEILGVNYD